MSAVTRVPVLAYHEYLGPDGHTVYTTHYFCGSCRRALGTTFAAAQYPDDLERQNRGERGWHAFEREDADKGYAHVAFCPWCGVEFEDEWWKDRTIQNERVIDHYQNPGTHKGDTHEFRGKRPDCIVGHWLGVSGGDKVCWCAPEVEPGLMGCVIRHQDKSYEEYLAIQREMAVDSDGSEDDWDG